MISPSSYFLATGACLFAAYLLAQRRARRVRRLESALGGRGGVSHGIEESKAAQAFLKPEGFSSHRVLAVFLESRSWARGLRRLLDGAGKASVPLDRFILGLAAAVLGFLVLIASLKGLATGLAAAGVALYCYLASLQVRRTRKDKLFGEQFCDGVRLLLAQLRAGRNLRMAMETVGTESPAPLGTEFSITYNDWQAGARLEDALEMMNQRNSNQDLPLLSSALRVAHRTGGGHLIHILENLTEIVQERKALYSKARAVTASQRMSGAVIGGAPFVIGGLLYLVSPDYLTPLFSTKAGHSLLALAAGLQVTGYLVIRRILDVKL